jgi:hypothetical protein
VKPDARPPLKPTPPPFVKKEPIIIKPVIIEKKEDESKKKKKRFTISGYQRAGELSNDVSSESILTDDVVMRPSTPTPDPEVSQSTTTMELDVKVEPELTPVVEIVQPSTLTLSQFKEQQELEERPVPIVPKSPTKSTPAEAPKISTPKELDSEPKRVVRVKYCLPLCAYYKPGDSKPFPLPAADSSRWGMLQSSHTRLFLDLQLAFCLGLESGRQLLEKYPNLISRVATMAEKEALESTVVSSRLLKSMLKFMDRKWINTTSVENEEALKITDLDIHLISWTPELYQILKSHRISVEGREKVDVDWIHDLKWPYEEKKVPAPFVIPQKYEHKLKKRFRS